jgi:hypothetical protein
VREQIKWLTFAASVVALGVSGAVIHGTLFTSGAAGSTDPLFRNLLEDTITLSFGGVPVAIGFAVLKYRLYDIDIIINRTLVYGSLTIMLATVCLGGVTATLVIAALFNPLRRRVQSFIDRRFYRKKYDARKTLEGFSARLRNEMDLDGLNAELVAVVRETMQPEHVSVWLRPDTPLNAE